MKNQTKRNGGAMGVLNRILGYMLHYYGPMFALVIVCILISAVATVLAATFPQTLVDDYITPMLATGSRDFSALAHDMVILGCEMALGVVASFAYNRIMVNISQGTMRCLRNDLFQRMEALPIKYFDTHAHGEIGRASCRERV